MQKPCSDLQNYEKVAYFGQHLTFINLSKSQNADLLAQI